MSDVVERLKEECNLAQFAWIEVKVSDIKDLLDIIESK